MNLRWQKIQNKLNLSVDQLGSDILYFERVSSGSDSFDTGSLITYGYGDPIVYWITGSAKAIITPKAGPEDITDAGYSSYEKLRLQVRSDCDIDHWDRVMIPSGSGILYHVQDPDEIMMGNIIISKYVDVVKLRPKSGSVY